MRLLLLPLALVSLAATAQTARLAGQPHAARLAADDPWCDREWTDDRHERACEVVELILPAGALDVAVQNGGVTVKRWDRDDVLVRARIEAAARTETQARRWLGATGIDAAGGRIRPRTPDTGDDGWVTVSLQVFAPRGTDLAAVTQNGPLAVHGLDGTLRVEAVNGPVALEAVAGDVRVASANGPVTVALDGRSWRGAGLDVSAQNGPIRVELPRRYDARLDAATAVSRIDLRGVRVPEADRQRGRLTGDALATTLGTGGALLRLRAQNGPIELHSE